MHHLVNEELLLFNLRLPEISRVKWVIKLVGD